MNLERLASGVILWRCQPDASGSPLTDSPLLACGLGNEGSRPG